MPHQPGLKLAQTITQIDDENANFIEAITEPLGYNQEQICIMIDSAVEALEAFRKEVQAR